MNETIIVALLSLAGTLVGSFFAQRKSWNRRYRLIIIL